jgi:Flp pilus assembly protein TadG
MTTPQVRTAFATRRSTILRIVAGDRMPALRPGLAWRRVRTRSAGSRAVAALEFAIASPLLLVMLAGAADLGRAQYSRALLANAVAAGAEYAYLTASSVSPSNAALVTTANITSVIRSTSGLANAATAITVTYSAVSPGVPGPGWYCVTGSGPTITASTSGGTCTDGSSAGYFISFQATYSFTGLLNGFMSVLNQTMSEQATVKLQ